MATRTQTRTKPAKVAPRTFEVYDLTGEEIDKRNALWDAVRDAITDKATGWATVMAARKVFLDALAPLVFQLRGMHRRRVQYDEKGARKTVIVPDWQGMSPEYQKAWAERIRPLITEHTDAGPDAAPIEDADYSALQRALNRRVQALVMADPQASADVKYAEKLGAGKKGRTASTRPTVALPQGTFTGSSDEAEQIFAPVEVPKSVANKGVPKLAASILEDVRRLNTMVTELQDSGGTLSENDRNGAAHACTAAAILLLSTTEGQPGIAQRLMAIKVEGSDN